MLMTKRISFMLIVFSLLFGFFGRAQTKLLNEPINISNTGAVCPLRVDCHPALVVHNDNVYLVWTQIMEGDNSAILFTSSKDGGESFSSPTAIFDAPESMAKQPAIAVLSDETILVAWSDDRHENFDILLTRSKNGGSTWQWDSDNDYLNISENQGNSIQPDLAVSADDTIVIAWSDDSFDETINPNRRRNIFLRTFDENNVEGFTQAINLSGQTTLSSSVSAERPSVAVNPDDSIDVFVAWEQRTSRTSEIFFNQSTPFSTPINISNTLNQNSHNPVIAVRNNPNAKGQRVLVLWREYLSTGSQIFSNSAFNAGVPFVSPIFSENPFNLSQVTIGSARAPAVTTDRMGNLFVVWEEERERNVSTIRLRTSLDPFGPPENISTPQDDFSHSHLAAREAKNPVIAVDESSIYIAWVEETESSDGFDIFFLKREIARFNGI